MKFAWLSDIHLDHLSNEKFIGFVDDIIQQDVDGYFVTGDFSHGLFHETVFNVLEKFLHNPFYFILGNHDYYHSSFEKVRERILSLTEDSDTLFWMNDCGIVELTNSSCLIGHDGWYDARYGDYRNSDVILNDFLLIEDLVALDKDQMLRELNTLGDQSANYFRMILPGALKTYKTVYLLTHVSPFVETAFYKNGICDDLNLPFFANKALGDYLLETMSQNKEKELVVLCGHTHSGGEISVLPNLHVKVAPADYGTPKVHKILHIE
jgi:predicted MPP superfamily phosphohydrolase